MHTHMSTSLVNHYQVNLQGYWTCTGIAKVELSASPSINIYQCIHHMTHVCFFTHLHTHTTCIYPPIPPTHTHMQAHIHTHTQRETHKYTHTHTHTHTQRHTSTHTHTHTHTYQFLEETVSVLAVFQWTHFPTVIHHIRAQQYLVII